MVTFVALLGLNGLLHKVDSGFFFRSSQYWIYPVQTLVCAGLVLWFRREYNLERVRGVWFALAVGIAVFVLWIAPQQFLQFSTRTEGFNPDLFVNQPVAYWTTVLFRFARLVIIVPFVEEIFWRGFLLRYFIREDFTHVPFGTFSWFSFSIVALVFAFSHSMADWPAAAITGAIYNGVAYKTKSLSACILTHATTNLLLGVWIMCTKQWGFW
jgi:CAAX prenyl protease-like protein